MRSQQMHRAKRLTILEAFEGECVTSCCVVGTEFRLSAYSWGSGGVGHSHV